jgi:hypothetical protein
LCTQLLYPATHPTNAITMPDVPGRNATNTAAATAEAVGAAAANPTCHSSATAAAAAAICAAVTAPGYQATLATPNAFTAATFVYLGASHCTPPWVDAAAVRHKRGSTISTAFAAAASAGAAPAGRHTLRSIRLW